MGLKTPPTLDRIQKDLEASHEALGAHVAELTSAFGELEMANFYVRVLCRGPVSTATDRPADLTADGRGRLRSAEEPDDEAMRRALSEFASAVSGELGVPLESPSAGSNKRLSRSR